MYDQVGLSIQNLFLDIPLLCVKLPLKDNFDLDLEVGAGRTVQDRSIFASNATPHLAFGFFPDVYTLIMHVAGHLKHLSKQSARQCSPCHQGSSYRAQVMSPFRNEIEADDQDPASNHNDGEIVCVVVRLTYTPRCTSRNRDSDWVEHTYSLFQQ